MSTKGFEKIHLNLYKGQREWLQEEYPNSGYSKAIRAIIDRHIRTVTEAKAKATDQAASGIETNL